MPDLCKALYSCRILPILIHRTLTRTLHRGAGYFSIHFADEPLSHEEPRKHVQGHRDWRRFPSKFGGFLTSTDVTSAHIAGISVSTGNPFFSSHVQWATLFPPPSGPLHFFLETSHCIVWLFLTVSVQLGLLACFSSCNSFLTPHASSDGFLAWGLCFWSCSWAAVRMQDVFCKLR